VLLIAYYIGIRGWAERKRIRLHEKQMHALLTAVSNCPPPLGHSLSHCTPAIHQRTLGCCVTLPTDHPRCAVQADQSGLSGTVWSVVSRVFAGLRARNDVRTNRGYVIAEYVISN